MHTVHVITVLTTRRLVELVALVALEAAVLCRVESVAVTVSGGGTTAGPGSSHRDSELLAPHSLSFSSLFHLCFSVFACTSHESPCVMSSLIPPPFHAHIPSCVFLLSGPGSDSFFRVRASGSDFIFRVRAPGSHSFSRAPAPSVLPLSSPSSDCPKTHAPFPPSPHFVFFRELNIHHSNSISIYNKTIYHQT